MRTGLSGQFDVPPGQSAQRQALFRKRGEQQEMRFRLHVPYQITDSHQVWDQHLYGYPIQGDRQAPR